MELVVGPVSDVDTAIGHLVVTMPGDHVIFPVAKVLAAVRPGLLAFSILSPVLPLTQVHGAVSVRELPVAVLRIILPLSVVLTAIGPNLLSLTFPDPFVGAVIEPSLFGGAIIFCSFASAVQVGQNIPDGGEPWHISGISGQSGVASHVVLVFFGKRSVLKSSVVLLCRRLTLVLVSVWIVILCTAVLTHF